jgi:hypothetical protein
MVSRGQGAAQASGEWRFVPLPVKLDAEIMRASHTQDGEEMLSTACSAPRT